jgi:peptide/nickel transport system permease protein
MVSGGSPEAGIRGFASLGRLRRRIEPGSPAWYFRRDVAGMAGLIFVVLIVLAAILAPVLAPYPAQGRGLPHPSTILQNPSWSHWMGTDELGRDVLSRVLFGARSSLTVGFVVVALGASFGTALGAIAGFAGGLVDEVIMRITDVFLSFPPLLLAISLAAALQPSLKSEIIAISITWWPWYTRLARVQAVSVRERRYVYAARTMGARPSGIIWRHIRPNIIEPIRVQAALDVGSAILAASALSFLNLGPQPPIADWGVMIANGRDYVLAGAWWLSVFPGLALFLTALATNLVADSFSAATNEQVGMHPL